MRKFNILDWKGLCCGLFSLFVGIGASTAQTSADMQVVAGATANQLLLQVRLNNATAGAFSTTFSGFTATIRYPESSTATLGLGTGFCGGPTGFPIAPTALVTNAGTKYRTYSAFGTAQVSDPIDDGGCELTIPFNTWFTVLTIPVNNNPGCTTFTLGNDAFTALPEQNRNCFVSLDGNEKTLTFGNTIMARGTCTADCLGVVGGTALPGTACDDLNPNTTNDTWSAGCVCAGTVACTPPSAVNVGSNSPICSNGTLNLTATFSGTATGATFLWTGTGTFSPSNTAQNPSVTGAASGTYSVTVTNGCGNSSGNTSATVTLNPSATISYAGSPYCSSGGTASVTRTGTAGGGYTAAPAGLTLNASTGAVTLGTSTPGTYTVTYTVAAGGGCSQFSTTASITVTAAPAATISYTGSPYCTGGGTATVTRTGTSGGGYTAVPAGLTLNASTGDVTLGTSTPGTYTVTYTMAAAGGCAQATATGSITISSAPSATISYAGSPYCSNGGTASVTRTGSAGGGYTAVPAGLTINASTGAVTLGTSTPGTYTVTYAIAAGGGCSALNTTASITITAAPSAAISYTGSPYCTGGGTASVTRTGTAGGGYTAVPAGLTLNASTGDVTLGTSTPGAYTVTYTMAATGGCAQATATASITISSAPSATISYAGSPYCSNGGTATVTRTGSAGGGYTAAPAGLSINAGTGAVDLGASTPGTYTVTYAIAAGGGCSALSTTASITITGASSATISYASPLCSSAAVTNVTRTGTAGGGYTAAPAGLSINASTGAITPGSSTAGIYTVTYTIAANGGCTQFTTTASVTITAAPSATISYSSPLCSNAAVTNVTLTGTAGGAYTAAPAGLSINASTGAITPGSSTAGTYTVTYTIAAGGGCTQFTTTASVTITAAPSATIGYGATSFCTTEVGTVSVIRTGTAGGTYAAAPGLSLNTSTGAITPSSSSVGNYTVAYTIPAANGCAQFSTNTSVGIRSPVSAGLDGELAFCSNDELFSLINALTFPTPGGTWTDPFGGSFSGTFNPRTDAPGVYTYTTNSFPPCPGDQSTVTITHISLQPWAGTSGSLTVCSNAAPVSLFNGVGEAPQTTGTWTFNSQPHSSTYDPAVDAPGIYFYEVSPVSPCTESSVSTVNVTENTATTWYADTDGDGFGNPAVSQVSCTQPVGFVNNNSDNCPAVAGVVGSACNDGNAQTVNDVLNASCQCVGSTVDCDDEDSCTADTFDGECINTPLPDGDGDGTCDLVDGCPGDPNKIAPGVCGCGVPDVDSDGDGTLNCNDGCPNDPNKIAPGICGCGVSDADGDGDGTANCNDGCPTDPNKIAPGVCGCGVADTDSDGDGLANCVDNCPNLDGVQGDACNDGNVNTINDVINASCVCVGVPIPDEDCEGVAGGPALPGTPCDDEDENTTNDTWSNACICIGEPLFDCPLLEANIGDDCNDGNANTIDDVVTEECECVGTSIFDCPLLEANIGDDCNDNNANTINDVVTEECECMGTLMVDCEGVPGGTALPGTACDDEDENTAEDTWSNNCECIGTSIFDCPLLEANIGDACNDGDANTTNDVVTEECECIGTSIFDCPLLEANIGDACNDNNANTINDTVTETCACIGTPVVCANPLILSIKLDAFGSQTTWQLLDESGATVVAEGGPYTNGSAGVVNEPICVDNGCYHLVVSDASGNGITAGGYVLSTASGARLIDANGSFTASSQISTPNDDFCVPMGPVGLRANWCDRPSLLVQSPIYSEFQAGASGYQFWIYDPHGSYNRRALVTTTTLVPANLNTNPVPTGMDLNVRVRPLVNGTYLPFGPACRVRFAPNHASRPESRQLLFDEGSGATMQLYPNPNRGGTVYLNMEGLAEQRTTVSIDIHDAVGQVVHTEQTVETGGSLLHTMDLSKDLTPGLYIVNVTVGEQRYTQRLIMQ